MTMPDASTLEGLAGRSQVFGIECEHHYGITTHPMPADGDVAREVYRLIREAWHAPREGGGGLGDDDHAWRVQWAENPDWFSRIDITKNERSPQWIMNPFGADDGPGAHWFSQEFRVVTRGLIEREIAERIAQAVRCEATAEGQRDTIRGRKARAKYTSIAVSARREAELIRSRWPEFDGCPRTAWQERMHMHQDRALASIAREGSNNAR